MKNLYDKKIFAELEQEVLNRPLKIEGKVPDWLQGTLFRNGPVNVKVNGKRNKHWFDGLAMLHAFSFQQGKVNYTNQFLRSEAYDQVFDKGSLNYLGFASDPCRSIFKKWLTLFSPYPIHNANVNIAKISEAYVALTEAPLPVRFDPQTLKTLGVLKYQDQLPFDRCWESAHPHYDEIGKRTINYLIQYGKESFYTFYSIADGSCERKIIANLPVKEPAYMHSFAVTEHYLILTEYPFVVSPFDLMSMKKPFIENFSWVNEKETQFIVIDKQNGRIVGRYVAKPFFAFHHANAFENGDEISLDIVVYEDAKIITSFYAGENAIDSAQLKRFTFSLQTGRLTSEVIFSKPNEFPRINQKFDGKPYEYVYLAKNEHLYKVNTATKEVLEWSSENCSTAEPVFVSCPQEKDEDEGVVLSVILDKDDSFLLILDGKSFEEMGRCRTPYRIPPGLHGQFY